MFDLMTRTMLGMVVAVAIMVFSIAAGGVYYNNVTSVTEKNAALNDIVTISNALESIYKLNNSTTHVDNTAELVTNNVVKGFTVQGLTITAGGITLDSPILSKSSNCHFGFDTFVNTEERDLYIVCDSMSTTDFRTVMSTIDAQASGITVYTTPDYTTSNDNIAKMKIKY